MNRDCVWFYEEADVNWRECKCPDLEEQWAEETRTDCEDCSHYYTEQDAKADAHASRYEEPRVWGLRNGGNWKLP